APWINMDEIVVRYSAPPAASGVPQPGTVLVHGQRSDYLVQTVTQIDPQTFALKLNRNLGVLPDNTDNGDRVTLTVPNGGPGGSPARDVETKPSTTTSGHHRSGITGSVITGPSTAVALFCVFDTRRVEHPGEFGCVREHPGTRRGGLLFHSAPLPSRQNWVR